MICSNCRSSNIHNIIGFVLIFNYSFLYRQLWKSSLLMRLEAEKNHIFIITTYIWQIVEFIISKLISLLGSDIKSPCHSIFVFGVSYTYDLPTIKYFAFVSLGRFIVFNEGNSIFIGWNKIIREIPMVWASCRCCILSYKWRVPSIDKIQYYVLSTPQSPKNLTHIHMPVKTNKLAFILIVIIILLSPSKIIVIHYMPLNYIFLFCSLLVKLNM